MVSVQRVRSSVKSEELIGPERHEYPCQRVVVVIVRETGTEKAVRPVTSSPTIRSLTTFLYCVTLNS